MCRAADNGQLRVGMPKLAPWRLQPRTGVAVGVWAPKARPRCPTGQQVFRQGQIIQSALPHRE